MNLVRNDENVFGGIEKNSIWSVQSLIVASRGSISGSVDLTKESVNHSCCIGSEMGIFKQRYSMKAIISRENMAVYFIDKKIVRIN